MRHLHSLHFPGWPAFRQASEPRNAASGASRMLGVDFCNQLSKTVHSRGDRISIATTFVVTDLHGQNVPNERNDDRMGHEVHLAVSPESSEVRLTPQPQLRLNLVDRCETNSQSRDPLGPHLGRRFRHSTRLTRSLLPLRVACRWTNPSRSDLAFTPRLACSAHTSMGRCDSQSEAASIAGFPNLIPKNQARPREPTGLATH